MFFLFFSSLSLPTAAAVENDELVVLLFGRMDLTCCVVVVVVDVAVVVVVSRVALKWFFVVRAHICATMMIAT